MPPDFMPTAHSEEWSPASPLAQDLVRIDAEELVAMLLAARTPRSTAAYRADLRCFAAFIGVAPVQDAAHLLLGCSPAQANALALRFRCDLLARGYAAATINRRLAALRSTIALGRTMGLVAWELEVANLPRRAYRDTRGPGDDGVRRMLNVAATQSDARKAARDVALLRLLHDVALRRGEVCALDLADVDLDARRLMVLGKGRNAKEPIALPTATYDALRTWIGYRDFAPGPLFTGLDFGRGLRASPRLSGTGVWTIVRDLGRHSGLTTWPHGLRHTSITRALDSTNGDVRRVQRFSRHRDVRTVMLYDDARHTGAADVAELVAMG